MSDPSVPFSKLKDQKSRKMCLDKKISAKDLWPSIKIQGIRVLSIRLHGIKLQEIKLPSIKLHGIMFQGIMPHGARLPSISSLSRDFFLPIRMANPRLTNQGTS
jgi:hypothetical protein